MHIKEILSENKPTFSFEYFPAKTEKAQEELFGVIGDLAELKPNFVSITYGAGGSTRELTHDLVVKIKERGWNEPIPHLTCVCHKRAEILEILRKYAKRGIGNILALGGDPPKNISGYRREDDDFQQAIDLVKFIKEFNESGEHPHRDGFGIGVAGFPEGHPATPNRLKELQYLKEKVEAGADYIVTQLFFDNRDFYDFRDRCAFLGIDKPIIAGIMPIQSLKGLERMAELSGGTRFPAGLLQSLYAFENDSDGVANAGLEYAIKQCEDLLKNGVDGIHFYTLNKSEATKEIYKRLKI